MLLFSYLSNFSNIAWSWCPENNQLKDVLVTLSILTLLCYLIGTWAHTKSARQKSLAPPLPPGPRGLHLVGNLPFLDPMFHTYLSRLAQTYGSIMKLQLGKKTVIVVSSSSVAQEVLKDHDIIFANRDPWAAALAGTYGGRDVAFTPYGPQWRTPKKSLHPQDVKQHRSELGLSAPQKDGPAKCAVFIQQGWVPRRRWGASVCDCFQRGYKHDMG